MADYFIKCDCCGKDYIYESSPMIRDELWGKVCGGDNTTDEWCQLFCRDCIEAKLGRKLTEKDLNEYIWSDHDQVFLKRFF